MDLAHTRDHPAAKNLVICSDGTGNEISENISNALKLYRCLRKDGPDAAAAGSGLRIHLPTKLFPSDGLPGQARQ